MVMAMEPHGIHLPRQLEESIELLHDLSLADFPARVITACQHLLPETCHGFSLWHRQHGTHTGQLHAPAGAGALEALLLGISTLLGRGAAAHRRAAAPPPALESRPPGSHQRQQPAVRASAPARHPGGHRHQLAIPLSTETYIGGLVFLRGGARGFDTAETRAAIQLSRHIPLAHTAALALAAASASPPPVPAPPPQAPCLMSLTPRQIEVLHWIAQGKRDKEIALILGVSHRTVTNHVRAILTKLDVETRTAAASVMRGG